MKSYRSLALAMFLGVLFFSSCKKEDTTVYQTITFENLAVPSSGFWNGSDTSGSFTSGKLKFANLYNSSWQTWSGFCYSQKNDVTTQGFGNQFSVFDAANGNNKFALFYPPFDGALFASFPGTEVHQMKSIDLCNNTYAALSMKNGDAYTKKFGGATGSDPDWFKVTLNGYDQNGLKIGSVSCYLADFRFTDSSKDFILNKWTTVDLTTLGKINKLTFEFYSSDTGAYGINTPTYVCLDNIKYIEDQVVL